MLFHLSDQSLCTSRDILAACPANRAPTHDCVTHDLQATKQREVILPANDNNVCVCDPISEFKHWLTRSMACAAAAAGEYTLAGPELDAAVVVVTEHIAMNSSR